jgi:hypothetical protein
MKRNTLWRFLLLALPVPLLLLVTYIALEWQMKLSGIVILGLFFALAECVVVFLCRCVAVCQHRRNEP